MKKAVKKAGSIVKEVLIVTSSPLDIAPKHAGVVHVTTFATL